MAGVPEFGRDGRGREGDLDLAVISPALPSPPRGSDDANPGNSDPEDSTCDEREEDCIPVAGAAICCPVTVTCEFEESAILAVVEQPRLIT